MISNHLKPQSRIDWLVLFFSLLIAWGLLQATWEMNYWPTDMENYILPASRDLPHLKYISQIHQAVDRVNVRWLHNKEMMVLCGAIAQALTQDTSTLRPFLIIEIASFVLSAILIYWIFAIYFGRGVGLTCYLFFISCVWPYLYILSVKHQPLGLVFFLLSLFYLQRGHQTRLKLIPFFFAGLFLGCSFFASPVSGLYLPYWLLAFAYVFIPRSKNLIELPFAQRKGTHGWWLVSAILLIVFGFVLVWVYVTFPDPFTNLRAYLDYLKISAGNNHFYYNQPVLRQWIDTPEISATRGGWVWVFRYVILVLPVLFPLYVFCIVFLVGRMIFRRKSTSRTWINAVLMMIAVSFSAPVLAEIRGVAQYGANYFPFLIGVLMVLGYTLFFLIQECSFQKLSVWIKGASIFLLSIVGLIHVFCNGYTFLNDVYPSRMATTFLSRELMKKEIRHVYTYGHHPLKKYLIACLNPGFLQTAQIDSIDNILQAKDGYIVVPPVSGDSLYLAMTSDYADFDLDIYLNALIRSKKLSKYAVASFPTLASSGLWMQEEEILSYRALILDQFARRNPAKEKVWLLDTAMLRQDFNAVVQSAQEDQKFLSDGIRNIGTKERLYLYAGRKEWIETAIQNIAMRIYKVGDPQDSLIAYVYTLDKDGKSWIPVGKNYMSQPVPSRAITANEKGVVIKFSFTPLINTRPGLYNLVIYRSGPGDDQNFYRIYIDDEEQRQSDLRMNFAL